MAPMTRRCKKALAMAAAVPVIGDVGRLTALPEEILQHIISFLPAQEAVRTCVLARTWCDIWRFTSRLRIDGAAKPPPVAERVRAFADRLFQARLRGLERAHLDACEITFDALGYNDVEDAEDWMWRAMECQVQALRVHFDRYLRLVLGRGGIKPSRPYFLGWDDPIICLVKWLKIVDEMIPTFVWLEARVGWRDGADDSDALPPLD
ncbi:hypothetical protein ACP70R_011095 [Stipagrostis hirtigluma subsp. patula]